MLTANPLKEKLASGRPVIGTWNTLGSPLTAEVFAEAGLDFLIIDFEHGPFQIDAVHEYVARCEAHGCSPIVRIPSVSDWMALQALDQGAHGLIVPHIDREEEARRLVEYAKYHPEGQRGFTPFSKAGGFTNRRGAEYAARANDLTLLAAIIESRAGLDNLEAILAVEGIDLVYFGAYDLSQALGVPGQVRHDVVLSAIKQGVAKTVKAGKCAGAFVAESPEDVEWLLDMGVRFITYGVDSGLIYRQTSGLVDWFAGKIRGQVER